MMPQWYIELEALQTFKNVVVFGAPCIGTLLHRRCRDEAQTAAGGTGLCVGVGIIRRLNARGKCLYDLSS